MSQSRHLDCYEYVNRPYRSVRDLLRQGAPALFQRATKSAAERGRSVAADLHASVAGVDVGVDVTIDVQAVAEEEGPAGVAPMTRLSFAWRATRAQGLFPSLRADLRCWALSPTETQLELDATYEPPFGVVGSAIDAAIGHRVAQATVHRFLNDVVEQLRSEIPATPASSPR